MLDIAAQLRRWLDRGERFALATVVGVDGSAPREPGAALAVSTSGEAVGSISGGCVEGAVYELALESLRTGESGVHTFGYSDADAFAVGLTCGGVLDAFVQPDPDVAAALDTVDRGEPVALATVIRAAATSPSPGDHAIRVGSPQPTSAPAGSAITVWPYDIAGSLGHPALDAAVVRDARAMLDNGQTGLRRYGPQGEAGGDEVVVFVQSYAPPPRMLIFGAIDFAGALARVGKLLGYQVTVCDARPVFATPKRFPDADEVVVEWPHKYLARTPVNGRTVVCVLSHDAKFDVPLLEIALRQSVAYVGAMGSRRPTADRARRLRALGLHEHELARLHAPIGLDIGARTPEETALSIGAEIVALRRGGTGHQLRATRGRIHRTPAPPLHAAETHSTRQTRTSPAAGAAHSGLAAPALGL